MEMNGLQLTAGEKVIRRYDFVAGRAVEGELYETEDSLIVTDHRVIRRVVGTKTFSQKEMVVGDINRVTASYQTNKHLTSQSNDPKKVALMIAGIIFLLTGLIFAFITARLLVSFVVAIVGVLLLVLSSRFKKVDNFREETVMNLSFYERTSDACIISIEKAYDSKAIVMDIANEIGAILFKDKKTDIDSDSSKGA